MESSTRSKSASGQASTPNPSHVARAVSSRSSPSSTPTSINRKRGSAGLVKEGDTPRKKRSTAKERSVNDPYHPENHLVDSLRPGLILVMIGLNPGLKTAETGTSAIFCLTSSSQRTGHAYSHHSNRFWPLLHESGITPKRHHPCDTHNLLDLYSIGNTNICARPSRDGSSLSKEELQEGAMILEDEDARLEA